MLFPALTVPVRGLRKVRGLAVCAFLGMRVFKEGRPSSRLPPLAEVPGPLWGSAGSRAGALLAQLTGETALSQGTACSGVQGVWRLPLLPTSSSKVIGDK